MKITKAKILEFFYVMFDHYIDELCDYIYNNPGPWKDLSGVDKIYSRILAIATNIKGNKETCRIAQELQDKADEIIKTRSCSNRFLIIQYSLRKLRRLAYTYVITEIGYWEKPTDRRTKAAEKLFEEILNDDKEI